MSPKYIEKARKKKGEKGDRFRAMLTLMLVEKYYFENKTRIEKKEEKNKEKVELVFYVKYALYTNSAQRVIDGYFIGIKAAFVHSQQYCPGGEGERNDKVDTERK